MSLLHDHVPVIDLTGLPDPASAEPPSSAGRLAAARIGEACRAHGFFYVSHHGVDLALIARLDRLAREFFALPVSDKLRWPMREGGRAWRGYFQTGGELTSGRPDWKEGLYLGTELTAGLYRSTPHRVRLNRGARDRLSIPLFLDPAFDSRVSPIPGLPAAEDDSASRWDASNVHVFSGTYGEYLMGKVGKVFPELGAAVLP